jgi:hypothetical protein
MMGLEHVIVINRESAVQARLKPRRPHVPDGVDEVDRYPPFPFPNLGSYVPAEWEITDDHWFVDKSGRGHDWEPALSVRQFRDALRDYVTCHPGHGFAITEEGMFQAVVSAMRRSRHAVARVTTG